MEIKISCAGNTTVNLDDLNDLQGNLKDLSEVNYVKLRNSITEFGFTFPIFFWEQDGKKYILDAHQRVRTLRKMRDEGAVIPLLPADPIFAENRTQAKKKLLLLNSRYGKMTEEGLYNFNNEPGFEIDTSFVDFLELPEFDFEKNDISVKSQPTVGPEMKMVTCPECHHQFNPEEAKLSE